MFCAQVAQLVEQRTENPRVGGSIPPLGTIFFIQCIVLYNFKNDSLFEVFFQFLLQ